MLSRTRTYKVIMTQPCTRCEGSGFIIGEGAGQCPHCVDGIETVETDIINALDHHRVFSRLHNAVEHIEALTKRVDTLEVEAKALRLLIQGLSSLVALSDYNDIARRLAAIETTLEPSNLLYYSARLQDTEARIDVPSDYLGLQNPEPPEIEEES